MKSNLFGFALCALATSGLMATTVTAAPSANAKHGAKKSAAAAKVTCPKCKMKISTKRSATANTPVKINGKTYYCCSACKMPSAKKVVKKASVGSAVQVKAKKAAGASSCCAHPGSIDE